MKRAKFAIGLAMVGLMSCNTQREINNQQEISMEKEIDKVSYSLGVSIGNNIKSQGLDSINVDAMAKAIKDVYSEGPLLVELEEAGKTINDFFQKKQLAQQEVNQKKGEAFLAENKGAEGVITLESGLQYKILKEGKGEKPTLQDKVTTHYHGTTVDGEVFDSSVERGEPASFPVNGVIPGWTEALQLMPVGSKWKLFVPSQLAYGPRGAGPKIGPNSTLIFEVELLSIE